MKIYNVDINKIYLSPARKQPTNEDYASIHDFACDILFDGGIITPITVMLVNDKYEIIDGNRRYLAMKYLNKYMIPCNIINQPLKENSVDDKQSKQMTDMVRSYLFEQQTFLNNLYY
jgi:hypothetical protein